MIAIVVLSLVLLKFETNRNVKPVPVDIEKAISSNTGKATTESASSTSSAGSKPATQLSSETTSTINDELNKTRNLSRARMKQILVATKRVPFKARITTEGGFKGFWTQNTQNYRFENPDNTQVIIFNATKQRLWVVDLDKEVAFETKFNSQSADAYAENSMVMFFETLSSSTETAARDIEDILPSGKKSSLTFNTIGLPKRWTGVKKDGTPTFIAWDYVQTAETSASAFELPAKTAIKSLSPDTADANN
jgi:hypothetical protein